MMSFPDIMEYILCRCFPIARKKTWEGTFLFNCLEHVLDRKLRPFKYYLFKIT